MKKKLKLLLFLSLILLSVFMLRVIQRFENEYKDKNSNTSVSGTSPLTSRDLNETNASISTDTSSLEESPAGDQALDRFVSDATETDTNKTANSRGSDKPASTAPMTQKALRKLAAGTILDITEPGDIIMNNCFYFEEIKDDIKIRIQGKSYKEDCTVPYEDLRYIRVLYYGFDEETHIGELIVNKAIATDIVDIFTELYEKQYPIESMVLVDEFDADDNTSMAADNTSSFNYRCVPGSTHLSKHALGLAIDINPLYNPYIQYTKNGTTVLPAEGTEYADRTLDNPYYIDENDLCYQAFTKRGFTWGGFWKDEPDYQHFQKTIN
jgi:hypothetical protein